MITVLIAAKCCQKALYHEQDFSQAWRQGTNILRNFRSSSEFVEIPFQFLENVGRQLFDEEGKHRKSYSTKYSKLDRRSNDQAASPAENGISRTPPRPVDELELQQATSSWGAPWATAMSEKTFQKLADPWEAWDLQWLEQFINIGE